MAKRLAELSLLQGTADFSPKNLVRLKRAEM